ncbi:sodium:proton antiporter [Candidatus Sumerlaeota bacterium]|nr:sodium:proton antiporter [Candidatus Sumerlaeota bacterium]
MPGLVWVLPFVVLLLAIAILPLIPRTVHWWERNRNKLLVSSVLAAIACAYYVLRGYGFHHADPGLPTLLLVLRHAVVDDYIPFIVLLFSLYTISGGINLKGDVPAHPLTNTIFLGLGALGASFIGTTGMAMLLIRPLLQINSERRHVRHTVVFFIFLVCNIGGCLLPIGDPPLFLGYLRRVPFFWTISDLIPEWAVCSSIVLAIYYVWDTIAYRTEKRTDIQLDEILRRPLRLTGKRNFILILGVIAAVITLVPNKEFPGTSWKVPHLFLREIVQLVLAGISLWITPRQVRKDNDFNFIAIGEVACLFIGIFITMQVPIEMLQIVGPKLAEAGFTHPWHFFWGTGLLSSFLDNAPTYVVFFSTATTLAPPGMPLMSGLELAPGQFGAIPIPLLVAISCGSVFMGANTYIGNGPNFMVKSIAEQSGIKMPSFFGYMLYSGAVLLPVFVLITFIFFR